MSAGTRKVLASPEKSYRNVAFTRFLVTENPVLPLLPTIEFA